MSVLQYYLIFIAICDKLSLLPVGLFNCNLIKTVNNITVNWDYNEELLSLIEHFQLNIKPLIVSFCTIVGLYVRHSVCTYCIMM